MFVAVKYVFVFGSKYKYTFQFPILDCLLLAGRQHCPLSLEISLVYVLSIYN